MNKLYWEDADIDWNTVAASGRDAAAGGPCRRLEGHRPGPGKPLQLFKLATDPAESRSRCPFTASPYPLKSKRQALTSAKIGAGVVGRPSQT